MGYTHYIKLDEPLTEAQAATFRDACMDFVSLVPDAFLGEALERPDDLHRQGMKEPVLHEHGSANQCLLEKDAARMAETMAFQGRGFLCLPRGTEELAVDPGKDWMCCKTGLRGSPPDSLVVCLIMAGQEALREGDSYPLRFHSDGTLDDMEQGLELWEDCTGAPPPRLPFVAGRRTHPECRPYMDRRTEAAQLLWSALLRLSGTGGIFEAAARERGEAGLRSAARKHEVIDACLEGFRTAHRAGAVCDFARDYVPAFAEACLEERSAGLRQDWRERLRHRLAPPCKSDVMDGGVMEGGCLPADGMAQGSMAGREGGSAQANGTAGQEEATPKQGTLFQPLSGSAEAIRQDAGASSDASDDLLEAAQCLWEAVLPRAVRGGGFD
ncbi:MAG: hypothetical protein IKT16_01490, partial [Desulfovibrio sp.]|nr:hypothetical protein [Desulfovibrio sp.]